MRFLPEHRIRDRRDFLHCYDHGRRFFSSGFVLFVVARPESGLPWRLGMAVTKKSGSAVWRNRLRRLIRESFRLAQDQVADGYDYVIVPKRGLDPRAQNLGRVSPELVSLLHSARNNRARPVPA